MAKLKRKVEPRPAAPVPVVTSAGAAGMIARLEEMTQQVDEASKRKDVVGLVRLMDKVGTACDRVASVKSALEALYSRLRFSSLPDAMDDRGIENIAVDGIGKCYLQDDIQVTVLNKDLLKAWFISHELEDLISETINASSLSAFVRRRMESGEELPKQLIKVRPYTRAVINAK